MIRFNTIIPRTSLALSTVPLTLSLSFRSHTRVALRGVFDIPTDKAPVPALEIQRSRRNRALKPQSQVLFGMRTQAVTFAPPGDNGPKKGKDNNGGGRGTPKKDTDNRDTNDASTIFNRLANHPITIDPAPQGTNPKLVIPRGTVPSTLFAPPYRSTLTITLTSQASTAAQGSTEDLSCLRHVNCSYLSQKGVAPTLEQLKQHAQSLVVLIRALGVSSAPGVVDVVNLDVDNGETAGGGVGLLPRFNENEPFDWLNDLSTPYANETVHHRKPLVSVMNILEAEVGSGSATPSDGGGQGIRICPLHRVSNPAVDMPIMPYATNGALIRHANEVLKLLDHEYSAKGGLMGILPLVTEKDGRVDEAAKKERATAETTLLGQMIIYIQQLVQRLHELERSYANAMDVLAGEAVVPHQALSRIGPDGRQGREIVYPQDRFVLVNAGEDVWQFLNEEFESKERVDEKVTRHYAALGVTGEAVWEKRGGKEFARGITAIDIYTRYYRLRDDPLKTIFVIPAHQEHPGTKITREMERVPTVVSVVKPSWPERASTWEMKNRADLDHLQELKKEVRILRTKVEYQEQEKKVLDSENKSKDGAFREAKQMVDELRKLLNEDVNKGRLRNLQDADEVSNAKAELKAQKDSLDTERADIETRTKALVEREREAEQRRFAFEAEESKKQKESNEAIQKKLANAEKIDADVGRAALVVNKKLKDFWRRQIRDTLVLKEVLEGSAEQVQEKVKKVKKLVVNEEVVKRATEKAERAVQGLEGAAEEDGKGDGDGDRVWGWREQEGEQDDGNDDEMQGIEFLANRLRMNPLPGNLFQKEE